MGESLYVAGFVLTRDDWDALGSDGREQILATLHGRKRKSPMLGHESASKVGPLPLPPPR